MIKKNGGIFGRSPTYNDVTVEGVLTLKEAQVFDNDITINGDLTVNGTETVINTVELNVDDKNITMGAVVAKVGLAATTNITAGQFTVQLADTSGLIPGMTVTKTSGTGAFGASPKIASVDSHTQITLTVAHATSGTIIFDTGGATDDTADGGGITLKGTTDKFIKWVKANLAWVFSDPIKAPDVTIDNLTASLPVFTDANKKLVTQSQQNALNAIAGAVTSARFLRGDGTNVSMSAIQASDVPTLNQDTTGSAGSVKSNATTGLLQVAGPGAGTTRVMTTPDANFSAARIDAAQTFTGAQTLGNIKIDTNTISSTNTNGDITISPNGTGALVTNYMKMGGASPQIYIQSTSTYALQLAISGPTAVVGSTNNTPVKLTTGGTAKLTINSADSNVVLESGNLIVGTSGKGIDFSATANGSGTMTSELFSNYEEGSFTPTWIPASGSGQTVSLAVGYYTLIGNRLYFDIGLYTNGHGTASGAITIGGLPYTASAKTNQYGGGYCVQQANAGMAGAYTPALRIIFNTTTLTPIIFSATTGSATMTAADWGVSGAYRFVGSYEIA